MKKAELRILMDAQQKAGTKNSGTVWCMAAKGERLGQVFSEMKLRGNFSEKANPHLADRALARCGKLLKLYGPGRRVGLTFTGLPIEDVDLRRVIRLA